MKHAIIIGGSGMLAGASLRIAEQGYKVSLIGRNSQKLTHLNNKNSSIIPVYGDYSKLNALKDTMLELVRNYGPPQIVVAWIHDRDEQVIQTLVEAIKQGSDEQVNWSLFHVLGSGSNLDEITREVAVPATVAYYQIQLGFVVEKERSRWLTHEEISGGVIDCIKSKDSRHLVGTLKPWHMRPFL